MEDIKGNSLRYDYTKKPDPPIRTRAYPRNDYCDALQKMINRMAVSQHKYGDLESNYPEPKNAMDNMYSRVDLYNRTGNTEFLLDAANFLVIEHLFPTHKEAHFTATDSDQSPGLF